ncbi:hypothetical protein SAMN05421749_101676 [Acinetobacter marinus]|uniref:DUF6160 domain-containing protein n=1 Tax=Acinetobacter marinus TaxID=281375 RepID=A0A1G6H2K9_9GAMM|nr:DUF6160 family protein [Acinetobacter marinus]SDB88358.1 hypothetical protein SAMN05421749_101676 [Acinetobacter marinus]
MKTKNLKQSNIRQFRSRRAFVLSALVSSLMLVQHTAYALQALEESDLRKIDGQDGIALQTEYAQIEIDQLYWEDQAGTASNTEQSLRAVANDVKIQKNPNYQSGNYSLGTSYEIDTGADTNGATGLSLKITAQPSTVSIRNFQLCAQTPSVDCNASFGNFAMQTGSPLQIALVTTDGLFNRNAQAELKLGLQNINIYTGLATAVADQYNQLILKNTNFNFYGKGVAYIDDAEGFVLNTNVGNSTASMTQAPDANHGYVDFERVTDPDQTGASTGTYAGTSSGINLEFMTKANAVVDANTPVYSTDNAKGLIRVGASGRIVNGEVQVRGVNANGLGATDNVLGFASRADQSAPNATGANATIIGSSGIGMRIRGEFTASGDSMLGGDNSKATTLEIGGAGSNTFGFEFGELKPLIANSDQRAYFDSGNVYLNMANTKHLALPENYVLQNSRFGGTSNTYLTKASDYIQQIHNLSVNPYSLVLAVRGAEFQALSKRGRFTSSSGVSTENSIAADKGLDNRWGLGLPFYNLNANMAMYSTEYSGDVFTLDNASNQVTKSTVNNSQRLGFSLAMSVDGKNTDGSKTTSILVIDGGDRDGNSANGIQATDYYFGLRNIDMLLSGSGSVGFENGNFNMNLPNLLMVMAAEIAAGYLPGAKYKSTGADVPLNNFNLPDDVLLGLKVKLLGDMNFALIPNNQISANRGNQLSIVGEYDLTEGTIQISDSIDGSMIGFDNMSGLVRFNNAIEVNKDNVGFNYSFDFNPNRNAADVFRVKDLNFYPPLGASNNRGQRLGEMVMTGGRLGVEMSITPRN